MYVFMVDYWVPFPQSEYGGLCCVTAEGEDQAVQLLLSEVSSYEIEVVGKEQIKQDIAQAVNKSKRLKLDPLVRYTAEVVTQFIT